MTKNVPIKLKPAKAAQAFVEAGEEPRASDMRVSAKPDKTDIVRVTLDLSKDQHRRLKIHVAGEGITIADYLRDLLDEKLP
jgi:predicted DNA binding CopG/RHH family protein